MLGATLTVLVIVTSLHRPVEHVGVRFSIPTESRFACEAAEKLAHLRKEVVFSIAERHMKAEARHITARRFTTECSPTATRT